MDKTELETEIKRLSNLHQEALDNQDYLTAYELEIEREFLKIELERLTSKNLML